MLEVRAISAAYGRIKALSGVSLAVRKGEAVALLGANGAGKTTTLNCISGVVKLTGGEITFEGERIDRLRSEQIVARGVVQVPEGREVFPTMSVDENLAIGAHLRRDRAGIARDRARMHALFPRLAERARQNANLLSGGEQQMLLIARALMARPRLLLLDEPSLGLSPILVEQIFATIRELRRDGLTLLVVEQNAQLALDMSDHATILENGEVAISGPSASLRGDPQVRRAYLGG